jgi:single-strand DNA-binding protein
MFALNKVDLLGNIGSDLELKHTPSGDAVMNFSLATNESYNNKNGEKVEHTEWHRIVTWRKTAELIAQLASKGSKIWITGKLKTRKWEKGGQDMYTTEIDCRDFILLDKAGGDNRAGGSAESGDKFRPVQSRESKTDQNTKFDEEDDYPFP